MHPAVSIKGLWKEYQIGGSRTAGGTFYDVLAGALRKPFARGINVATDVCSGDRFWALQDINADIQPGEVVGVIGRNGAGKSTLLKVLSRITAPTRGHVEVRGRLASLLEVGTGFHAELTGRENIYLNGAILGMSRAEVSRKFDEIVAFAEVEKFIDTPVKRYSSGMYVRLAFAVAAHLDADVLLVDEVLSVGDAVFQKKSISKMEGLAEGGKTVILVSHDISAVRKLCGSALLLQGGALVAQAPTPEVVQRYMSSQLTGTQSALDGAFSGPLLSRIRVRDVTAIQADRPAELIDPSHSFSVRVQWEAVERVSHLDVNVVLNWQNVTISACHDTAQAETVETGIYESIFHFPERTFRTGQYSVGVGAVSQPGFWLWGPDVLTLNFHEDDGLLSSNRRYGAIAVAHTGRRTRA